MGSGNPFAADSDVWKATSTPATPKVDPPGGYQNAYQGPQQRAHADADPFAAHKPVSSFPTAAAPPQQALDSFAELNPTAIARPAQSSHRDGSAAGSFSGAWPSYDQRSTGGYSGFNSQSSTPKGYGGGPPSSVSANAQNAAPPFSSQSSTPRQDRTAWPNNPPHIPTGRPLEASAGPSGYPSGSGQQLGDSGGFGGGFSAPSAQHGFAGSPFLLNPQSQDRAPKPSRPGISGQYGSMAPPLRNQQQSAPMQQNFGGWEGNRGQNINVNPWGQQNGVDPFNGASGGSAGTQAGFPVGFELSHGPGNPNGRHTQPPAADRSQPLPDFGFAQPSTGFGGFPQAQQAPEGSQGLSSEQNALADEKLWDFASLNSLRPQLPNARAAEDAKNKAGMRPMRPANDSSWVQPWATNSVVQPQSAFNATPGAGELPRQPATVGPSQTSATPSGWSNFGQQSGTAFPSQASEQRPASSSLSSQPEAQAGTSYTAGLGAAGQGGSGAPGQGGFGADSRQQQPGTARPEPAAKEVAQSSPARVPWALPPPTKDLPRPGSSGISEGTSRPLSSSQQATPKNPLSSSNAASSSWKAFGAEFELPAQQLGNLNLGDSQGFPESTHGDEELARQLQEQWNRENGAGPSHPASSSEAQKISSRLRRPSSVAGIAPSQGQEPGFSGGSQQPGFSSSRPTQSPGSTWQSFDQSGRNPATSGSGSRVQSFLSKAGFGDSEDEAYARRLQKEYDAERAQAAGKAADSTASRAGFWQGQPPQGQQTLMPQGMHSAQDSGDAALAQRLQQEEIARQQQSLGWPQPHHQSQFQPQQTTFGYPLPNPDPRTVSWSTGNQTQPYYQGYPDPGRQSHLGNWQSSNFQQQGNTEGDEAYARQLQEQLNAQEGNAAPQPASELPSRPSAPLWKSRFDRFLAPAPDSLCLGCKQPVTGIFGGTWRNALGGKWHPGCLKCGKCSQAISDSVLTEREGVPYHMPCYKELFHPRCCVCTEFCPEQDNQIKWMTDAFWRYKACPQHMSDGTVRCFACNRLQPRSEEWVQVSTESARFLCLDCISSIVVDTQDAQPLYREVQQFFSRMQMQLPTVPPLVLVESSALESAEVREGRQHTLQNDSSALVFHTRGLTLSMEYTNMRTVVRNRGTSWFDLRPEVVHIPGDSRCEVTAILVLAGLPRVMAGSILAHECMHAWLRLTGARNLPLEVEEGLCQLVALLYIENLPPFKKGEWEDRLSSYCTHQIRTETSPIYGDGFRAALDNFQKFGLPQVVAHVKQHGRFAI